MPTKFVVLWLQTVFITKENDEEDNDLIALTDHFPTLETALNFFNATVSNPINQQVMLLTPLKEFKRSK